MNGPPLNPILCTSWKLNKLYHRICARAAQDHALTQNEIDVLLFLTNNPGGYTAVDIARYRAISKSLVCKSVNALLERGFLTARKDPADRRSLHLFVTDQAREAVDSLQRAQAEFFHLLESGIGAEERAQLRALLLKMAACLDSHLEGMK